jgi:hypothetical protein
MKLLKVALLLSILLYIFSVGLLAMLKAAGFIQALSTPEMFFGPAITIVSTWIIFGIVYFIFERKKDDKRLNG